MLLLLVQPQPAAAAAAAAGPAAGLAAKVWVLQVGFAAEQQRHHQ
jgi:hypothetical protein